MDIETLLQTSCLCLKEPDLSSFDAYKKVKTNQKVENNIDFLKSSSCFLLLQNGALLVYMQDWQQLVQICAVIVFVLPFVYRMKSFRERRFYQYLCLLSTALFHLAIAERTVGHEEE